MAWTKLQYTREQVNAAAKALVAYDVSDEPWDLDLYVAREAALPIINNWRSSHSWPLNTFRINLGHAARQVDPDCILAQRIKRLSSISAKLRRFPDMKFSQMQDIGGCRAVVSTVDQVQSLVEAYKKSQIKHRLYHIDDYIAEPQASGYRGAHLMFKYFSDRTTDYNDLKIEMQLRSALQHAWATAVETIGTFLQQALKSSLGQEEWLRFFALMSSAIAIREGCPLVPGTPSSEAELYAEIYDYSVSLEVENRLTMYSNALDILDQQVSPKSGYFLLRLNANPEAEQLIVKGFRRSEVAAAAQEYIEAEKTLSKSGETDAVLVSVDSIRSLRRAYPNYFADTHVFLAIVQEVLEIYENEYKPAA